MKSLKKQKGLSTLGWLVVLALGGFFLTLGFKLGPAYLDAYFVTGSLKSLSEAEKELPDLSAQEIREKLDKYFTLNNIRDLPKGSVRVEQGGGKVLVNVNYEQRIPLFYNIEVILTFKNQLDSSRPGQCCTPLSE